MLPKELIKKIRRIEIRTNRLVNDVLGGEYHSVFKGRGMEFDEVREYQIGDDVRTIDWNVTARTGTPHVKRFVEERELTVLLMVDASSSSHFGTTTRMKGEMIAELCALLAFSAIKNNDRVGLIIFTEDIELYVPPKKGKSHVLRLIRDLLYFRAKGRGTNITNALEFLQRVQKRKAVVFLVSDFLTDEAYRKPLAIANQRHDVISVSVSDPREVDIPPIGILELEDAETGEEIVIDTSDPDVREMFAEYARIEGEERQKTFRSLSVDSIDVNTGSDYVLPLINFFKRRAKEMSA
ncbi:MAG: DUF58 domain-containing protein [Candidatus Omnitrophica bacterium]|nr:DUF58 domain-containing protein [Candidatus Omnitrophota bacterium]MCA9426368.1 DUF58 domain-containing protein [Candidatus Omnitrophota bacterium]MCA9441681.1 DUF58 domain-containing protein [Candidatus Omnitrophota bacterium]MCB9768098.1 DUF58 domain-containing protein [Candidatus Omnitrophota bacterium]